MTPVRSSSRFVLAYKHQLRDLDNQRLDISDKKLICVGKVGTED